MIYYFLIPKDRLACVFTLDDDPIVVQEATFVFEEGVNTRINYVNTLKKKGGFTEEEYQKVIDGTFNGEPSTDITTLGWGQKFL